MCRSAAGKLPAMVPASRAATPPSSTPRSRPATSCLDPGLMAVTVTTRRRGEETMTGILVVTGGSRGIGAATVRLAASKGWDVCVNYLRDESSAEAIAAEVREQGV